jgi:hypothetical protein
MLMVDLRPAVITHGQDLDLYPADSGNHRNERINRAYR